MKHRIILAAALVGVPLLAGAAPAGAAPLPPMQAGTAQAGAAPVGAGLTVALAAVATNPPAPRMGDRLAFVSSIRNGGDTAIEGVIAWLSLVQVDRGHEQPVDLEDWSAHKAIALASLAPGAAVTTHWPMRLIQAGRYRVVVSAVSRSGAALTPSRFVDFTVAAKPVVESGRVLPVALGVPGLLAGGLLLRRWRWRSL